MKKSSLKLRVPALLLGLALVLGLALTGCPSEASSEGGGVDGLKLSKPKNVTIIESKVPVTPTAYPTANAIPSMFVVNFEAPNQGARQVDYVIWIREAAKKKELLIAETGTPVADGTLIAGSYLAGPTNQQVLSSEVTAYALQPVSSLTDATLDRENGEDHKWSARIDADALLTVLDASTWALSTHTYTNAALTAAGAGASFRFQIGVQAVIPEDTGSTNGGDPARYFVNPSDITWNTKNPIVVQLP